MFSNHKSGFTLVQLIIGMAAFLVLAAAVFLWIDPLARIGETKNTKRTQDVTVLAAALANYAKENKGMMPVLGQITTDKKVLCSSQSGSNVTCDSDSELCLTIDDDDFYNYVPQLPYDPDHSSSTNDSGYYLTKDASDNLIVGACDTYNSEIITQNIGFKEVCGSDGAYGGGNCWYVAASANTNCNTVCSAINLDCLTNVRYGPDINSNGSTFCRLNKDLGGTCTTCTVSATGTPPVSATACTAQNGSVICSQAAGSGNYAICPCQ